MISKLSIPLFLVVVTVLLSSHVASEDVLHPVSRQVGCTQICRVRRRTAIRECRAFQNTGGSCRVAQCPLQPNNGATARRGFICRPSLPTQPGRPFEQSQLVPADPMVPIGQPPAGSFPTQPGPPPTGPGEQPNMSPVDPEDEEILPEDPDNMDPPMMGDQDEGSMPTLPPPSTVPQNAPMPRPLLPVQPIGCTQICRSTSGEANAECGVRMSRGEFCEVEGCTLFDNFGNPVGIGFVCRPRISPPQPRPIGMPSSPSFNPTPIGCSQLCRGTRREADNECTVFVRTGGFCEVEGCNLFNSDGFSIGIGFVCRPRLPPSPSPGGIGCSQICRDTFAEADNECNVSMIQGQFCEVEGCTPMNGGLAGGIGFICRPRIAP